MKKFPGAMSFDDCFQLFPNLQPPADLHSFWNSCLKQQKKIPLNPDFHPIPGDKSGGMECFEIDFQGHDGRNLRALLTLPGKKGPYPVVVSFHDYREKPLMQKEFLDRGIAHCVFQLREHEILLNVPEEDEYNIKDVPEPSLDFLNLYGLKSVELSYPYFCFLDGVRCIEMLKLHKLLNADKFVLYGKGFGGAVAVFAGSHVGKAAALVLDRPSFIWMEDYLKESHSYLALEIKRIKSTFTLAQRNQVLRRLGYLDVIYQMASLKMPVLATAFYRDRWSPCRPIFAAFNHITSDKTMELFPEKAYLTNRNGVAKKIADFVEEMIGQKG